MEKKTGLVCFCHKGECLEKQTRLSKEKARVAVMVQLLDSLCHPPELSLFWDFTIVTLVLVTFVLIDWTTFVLLSLWRCCRFSSVPV